MTQLGEVRKTIRTTGK